MTAAAKVSQTSDLDRQLETLRAQATPWLSIGLDTRVEYLKEIRRRSFEVVPAMIEEMAAAKGVGPEYGGEDLISGPISFMRTARFLQDTLELIGRQGRVAFSPRHIDIRPSGQITLQVVPADNWDRILYLGWRADVWLDRSVTQADLDSHLGSIYTKPGQADAKVALVLGAGNVASIGPLDLLHKLFFQGHVAMLKLNPINDYLGPHYERIFGELIEDGFISIAYGGAEVGSYLARHHLVDEIHITGASRTHDAIVFGEGEEGAARRAANRPLLDKPITSELGNVGPVVIVPGEWRDSDLRNQAEHVATQIVQNAGFNCNAAKVLVLPAAWPQKDEFMDTLRQVLRELPPRPSYYPGAEDRFERFRASHPNVEMLGELRSGFVPPSLLVGVDSEFEHLSFEEEAFCQIAATTELSGTDPAAYLDRAVEFCNDSLYGTLNATVLIDPATRKAIAPTVERAISRLRYGTIGINLWAAAGFVLGVTPWGAYPGHTLDDIQSGIGFVHNARLIDRPLKTVVEAPFRVYPKPAWSVYHRNSTKTLMALAAFEAEPSIRNLAAVTANAVRA